MEKKLKNFFIKNTIQFKEYKHSPIFTVEEAKKADLKIPATHTKSLFLKDEKNIFYLFTLIAEKRLNIKEVKKELEIKELNFAKPEELKEFLNVKPGSVSPFCIIHSKAVNLIIDKEVFDSEKSGFHPNINTSTIVLDKDNFNKFFNSIPNTKKIIKL